MRSILRTAFLAVGVLASGAAQAANALVTTDLNVRSGPSAGYPAIGMFPNGSRVNVGGCTAGYGWCQVSYGGMTGWASSRYLAMREGESGSSGGDFGSNAAAIGIPLIAGVAIGAAIANNHDHDRRDRWERRHWRDRDRWDRPGWGDDRRWDRDRPRWHSRDRWDDDRPRWDRDRPRWERRDHDGWRGRDDWRSSRYIRRGMGDGPHGQ